MRRPLLQMLLTLTAFALASCSSQDQSSPGRENRPTPTASQSGSEVQKAKSTAPVPAHFDHPPGNLGPTLPAEDFTGKTRAAYRVAEEIPETLSQLPCYCYCDRGMGHKSLHSCFEDEHAAHCAVCIDEALLAYSLQKDGRMTPAQVREKIIEKYSPTQ
ncbi:MAG: hypothetical protein QOD75_195 [Blastocatellia bacterium]|jgi:hypothetical protein|nr:hypothetical protein [Blastocatellia bacterium]